MATYTFTPEISGSSGGSYELSGTWNQESLELLLEAGDWIVEPEKVRLSNNNDNIKAELNVGKERIEGYAQGGSPFKVSKNEKVEEE